MIFLRNMHRKGLYSRTEAGFDPLKQARQVPCVICREKVEMHISGTFRRL